MVLVGVLVWVLVPEIHIVLVMYLLEYMIRSKSFRPSPDLPHYIIPLLHHLPHLLHNISLLLFIYSFRTYTTTHRTITVIILCIFIQLVISILYNIIYRLVILYYIKPHPIHQSYTTYIYYII